MFGETSGRRKRRRAFLDTLFEAFEEQQIDMDGIAEEVDTFMFEGYLWLFIKKVTKFDYYNKIIIRNKINK